MRSHFDRQLEELNKRMTDMCEMIQAAITDAITALKNRDAELAKRVVANDDGIDMMEKDIESLCLKILLQQQPVARDLRTVSTALKMITDMERIGDHASDISEITQYLASQELIKELEHIPMMADATLKMLGESIDAYIKRDLKLAQDVIKYDDVVDELFLNVRTELLEMIRQDPGTGEQAIDLLMIAKYFERIGDHAQNIAEWVEFSITGRHKDIQII